MKKIPILILILFVLNISLNAQNDLTLPGVIVIQNSRYNSKSKEAEYVSEAFIKSKRGGAKPVKSDNKGNFNLIFVDKPFGGKAFIEIEKYDMRVVNEGEINQGAIIGRLDPIKIVMCNQKDFEKSVLLYSSVGEKFIKKYQERINILETRGTTYRTIMDSINLETNKKITNLEDALTFLNQQLTLAEQKTIDLQNKFLSINLDDQSETYQHAFEAFTVKNDINLAISILDSVDFKQKLATAQKREVDNTAIIRSKQVENEQINKSKKETINALALNTDLYQLNGDFSKADSIFKIILTYDSSVLRLNQYTKFLYDIGEQKKALQYNAKALTLARNSPDSTQNIDDRNPANGGTEGVAYALLYADYLASLNYENENALKACTEALPLFEKLTMQDSIHHLFTLRLLEDIGQAYLRKKEYNKAIAPLYQAIEVGKHPFSKSKTKDYAWLNSYVFAAMSIVFRDLEKFDSALYYCKRTLEIRSSFYRENPIIYAKEYGLALNDLGTIYEDQKKYEDALGAYKQFLQCSEKLALSNPIVGNREKARACMNIGKLYLSISKYDDANNYFGESQAIAEKYSHFAPEFYHDFINILFNLKLKALKKQKKHDEFITLAEAFASHYLTIPSGNEYADKTRAAEFYIKIADICIDTMNSYVLKYYDKAFQIYLNIQNNTRAISAANDIIIPLSEKYLDTKEASIKVKAVYYIAIGDSILKQDSSVLNGEKKIFKVFKSFFENVNTNDFNFIQDIDEQEFTCADIQNPDKQLTLYKKIAEKLDKQNKLSGGNVPYWRSRLIEAYAHVAIALIKVNKYNEAIDITKTINAIEYSEKAMILKAISWLFQNKTKDALELIELIKDKNLLAEYLFDIENLGINHAELKIFKF